MKQFANKQLIKMLIIFIAGVMTGANYHKEVKAVTKKIEKSECSKYLKILRRSLGGKGISFIR